MRRRKTVDGDRTQHVWVGSEIALDITENETISYVAGIKSGYTYLRARYYDPASGRMLSEDTHWTPRNMIYGDNPQDPSASGIYKPDIRALMQSSNLYVYCMNNPVMYQDPSGHIGDIVFDIIGIVWSTYDLIKDPSWANAGYLALDVGSLFIPTPAAETALKMNMRLRRPSWVATATEQSSI
jgi:RHS repeat-associated protein